MSYLMRHLEEYDILHSFDILHSGWEMDNKGWVAKNKKGKLVFLSTDHGGFRDYGDDISELHAKLKETRESLAGIKKAIQIMTARSADT